MLNLFLRYSSEMGQVIRSYLNKWSSCPSEVSWGGEERKRGGEREGRGGGVRERGGERKRRKVRERGGEREGSGVRERERGECLLSPAPGAAAADTGGVSRVPL